MAETAREAVARASFDCWKQHRFGKSHLTFEDMNDNERKFALRHADAMIAALDAHRDAHGWQIVPKEPTQDMAAEGNEASRAEGAHDCEVSMTDVYRAMLAAAPKPPGE